MGRGIFSGAVWGVIVGGVCLALISVLDQPPIEASPDVQVDPQSLGTVDPDAPVVAGPVTQDSRPSTAVSTTRMSSRQSDQTLTQDATGSATAIVVNGVALLADVQALTLPVSQDFQGIQWTPASPVDRLAGFAQIATTKRGQLPKPQFTAPEPAPTIIPPKNDQPAVVLAVSGIAAKVSDEGAVPLSAPNDAEPSKTGPKPTASPSLDAEFSTNAAQTSAEPEVAFSPVAEFVPAVQAFAVPFGVNPDLPIVSLVLLDDGETALNIRRLAALPFAITVAVPANAPDVLKRATALTDAGIEVAITGDAPKGSDTSSLDAAYLGYVSAAPTSVAVVGGQGLGIRGGAARLATLRTQFLDTGHGFLALSENAKSEVNRARAAGIPALTVFRDLDSDGQNSRVIRRFMDQAARSARREGPLVLVGRMQSETLLAFAQWGEKDRSGSLNIAPLSAALLAGF